MSPVEQDKIDCDYLAYFWPKKIEKKNYNRGIMQLVSADTKGTLLQRRSFFTIFPILFNSHLIQKRIRS